MPWLIRWPWQALGEAAQFCQRCHKAERARALSLAAAAAENGGVERRMVVGVGVGEESSSLTGGKAGAFDLSPATGAFGSPSTAANSAAAVSSGEGGGLSSQFWLALLEEYVGRMRGAVQAQQQTRTKMQAQQKAQQTQEQSQEQTQMQQIAQQQTQTQEQQAQQHTQMQSQQQKAQQTQSQHQQVVTQV